MNRDSVVFYLSFYEAIRELPEKERLKAFEMVFDYAFKGIEPTDNGIALAIFKLVKPQIDANNKRYENGKKPKRSGSKTEANSKQNISESEANVNVNDNVNVNVNVNENANANANVKENDCKESSDELSHTDDPKHQHGEYKKVLLTDDELGKLYAEYGKERTDQAIEFLDSYIVEKSYKSKSHYLAIRRWVFQALDEQEQRRQKFGNAGTNKVAQQLDSFYEMARDWAERG